MIRITEQSMLNSNLNKVRKNFHELEASQTRLSTGKRVNRPHEDVVTTINSLYYRSRISMIDQYQENITDAQGRMDVAYGAYDSLVNTLQRARELTVQGANGIYTKEERKAIAMEMEQLLSHVHQLSLTKYKGEYIFSGNEVKNQPFRMVYQQDDTLGTRKVVAAVYEGDYGKVERELEDDKYMDISLPGNKAFWATNSEVVSNTDAQGYIVDEKQTFMIDNMKISVERGDNLEAIVDKINGAQGNVKAGVMIQRGGEKTLHLTSRAPHMIMLEDIEGGTVLQDLGLIREGMANAPGRNFAPDATVSGQSIFEVFMKTRDALLENDSATVGSLSLGLIDEALANATHMQAELSAKVERIGNAEQKFEDERMYVTEALSKGEDVNYADEMVNFNMWEYIHRASLQTAAKLLQPTLMDYMR